MFMAHSSDDCSLFLMPRCINGQDSVGTVIKLTYLGTSHVSVDYAEREREESERERDHFIKADMNS